MSRLLSFVLPIDLALIPVIARRQSRRSNLFSFTGLLRRLKAARNDRIWNKLVKLNLPSLLLAVVLLAGCAEAQLGAHVAKQIAPSRSKGFFKVGNPYTIAGKRYYPKESYTLVETGIASWYGHKFHGKKTANGEIFDRHELTAAHRTLQLPSLARVTNLENGRSLVVRVNDRGPYKRGRIIDLSEKAAELLGYKNNGTARVKLQVLDRESRAIAEAARRGVDTSGVEIAMNKGRPYPATTKPKPVTPQPPEPASYKTASLQPVKTEPLTGHTKGGHFMPDPVVSQVPVQPTNLFVQAGAFTVRDNAFRYAEQLSRLGNAKVYPVMINGKRFYRVRLGPFDAVRYADAMLEKLVAANYNDAIIVVE